MKYLALFACLAIGASAFAQSFSSTGGPYNIPDNDPNGVTAQINVNQAVGSLLSVSFSNLHHTWIGDVTFLLTDPSNNSVYIMQRPGVGPNSTFGNSSDFAGTSSYAFAPGGSDIWLVSGVVPAGTYAPSSNSNGTEVFTNFNGVGGQGTWSFFASDSAGGDTGGFDVVTLNFAPVPEPASMAALGLGVAALIRRRKKA